MNATTAPVIPLETARHVLWFYGHEGGIQPGTFTENLITAIDSADMDNTAALANAFPSLVAAVIAAKHDPNGIKALQRAAGMPVCIRCGDTDGPFAGAPNQPLCEGCHGPGGAA